MGNAVSRDRGKTENGDSGVNIDALAYMAEKEA